MSVERPTPEDERVAEQLSGLFGGTWTAWRGGGSKTRGLTMWSQVRPNADDRGVLTGLVILGDGITADSLRQIPVVVLEQAADLKGGSEDRMRRELAKLAPLERGDLSADEFAGRVAEHYRLWARFRSRPAAAMSEEWGVNLNTMHSWIRGARERGLLPEAERGKRARG